jgi:MFS family permease
MTHVRATLQRTFGALGVRNYRLYFSGQVVSVSGTWMQTIAQIWLVLVVLHGTGFDVGAVTALQFVPMLLFGTFGGLVVDRFDKRRLLFFTQGSAAVLAVLLALLTFSGTINLWEVYLFAILLGFVNLFDNPTRQAFASEMVGADLLPNAVSLNSVLMNSARVIGPAIGGGLLAIFGDHARGIAICFFVNAASYVAVILALALMRKSELLRHPTVARAKGQIREGLRYVRSTPDLLYPLLVMAVVGIFAFNFTTTLPLLARYTFHGTALTYSALTVGMGVGAVVGGLFVAHRSRPSPAMLSLIGLVFGVMIFAVAVAPSEVLAVVFLVPMGAASIAFIATANATLQLRSEPSKRGRVMALFAIAFLGSTPIGAPIMGAVSQAASPRVALLIGAVATLAASTPLFLRYARRAPSEAAPRASVVTSVFSPPDALTQARERRRRTGGDHSPSGAARAVGEGGP